MTTLQKLCINLFPLFLFSYDNNFHITGDINLYSDKLYFDIFDSKWETLPSNEPMNRAIDYSSISIYKNFDNYAFGYKYKSEGVLKINKGFIQTWYYADSDFNTLTKKNDVGYYISEPTIYGLLNYYQNDSLFLSKFINNFKFTVNLIRAKQLQYMKVTGSNTENRFLADLSYYYTDKNLVTKNVEDDNYYGGFGSSFDIEYKKTTPKYNIYGGIYNILGFINWRSVTYLEYHFDSKTRYVGEDGYYHYKPFGVGQYKRDVFFHQKLPIFMKYGFSYKSNIEIGDKGLFSSGARFDEFFCKYKHIILGYIPQTKNVVYGFDVKHFKIEVSNNIKNHSKTAKLYFDIWY